MRDLTIAQLLEKYPFVVSYFTENKLDVKDAGDKTFSQFLEAIDSYQLEDRAIDKEKLESDLWLFIEQMAEFLNLKNDFVVESLTILPGQDKFSNKEKFVELTIRRSEIISIVGPTGSGKSRLLADIEWMAQNDTPTKRAVLINGEKPNSEWRFSSNKKLVAQLSQNMNFVMDLTVEEFLRLHAESKMREDVDEIVDKIVEKANDLSGEKFVLSTPVTSLSGGQSRALMIADTALLSNAPIVLIDEIENAGIDRKKALELLVSENKIVLMATHDPILALAADKRIVIKNGGIERVLATSAEEKKLLSELEKFDDTIQNMRHKLRAGEALQSIEIKG